MKRFALVFALVAALIWAAPATSRADTALAGTTDGGAFFLIVVPTLWNGDLVLWNHGFSLSPIGPVGDLGPLATLQLSEGYAVAATSYQQIGWALFKTKNDTQNMVSVFEANFGVPGNILINGASLGGIVTAHQIEKANIGNVVGALPFCGAVAGSRNWDAALDLRLVYDVICSGVPGAAIPGGATGLPAPGFPSHPFGDAQFGGALQACFGIFAQPNFRTPGQTSRLAAYMAATQIPTESFVVTDMGFGVFAYSNVIHDPAKLNGQQGVGNAGVTYPDAAIDAAIQRVSAHPGGANRISKNFTPKGNVGSVKIVSIHTDGDGLVIVENEKEYADVVPAGNLTTAIVNEAGNTHCGFTGGELVSAWESLRGWVAGGPQPTVTDIQASCGFWSFFFGGPCRYDPSFVIPDMDGRVPPR